MNSSPVVELCCIDTHKIVASITCFAITTPEPITYFVMVEKGKKKEESLLFIKYYINEGSRRKKLVAVLFDLLYIILTVNIIVISKEININ